MDAGLTGLRVTPLIDYLDVMTTILYLRYQSMYTDTQD